jgi:hypothetical protein
MFTSVVAPVGSYCAYASRAWSHIPAASSQPPVGRLTVSPRPTGRVLAGQSGWVHPLVGSDVGACSGWAFLQGTSARFKSKPILHVEVLASFVSDRNSCGHEAVWKISPLSSSHRIAQPTVFSNTHPLSTRANHHLFASFSATSLVRRIASLTRLDV